MNERATAPQRKAVTAIFSPVGGAMLQCKCACGQHTVASGECAECRKKRLQRKTAGHTDPETSPPIIHEMLRSLGQPLDEGARTFMVVISGECTECREKRQLLQHRVVNELARLLTEGSLNQQGWPTVMYRSG